MLVTGDKISKAGFIKNLNEDNIKNACYYLTIDSIIPAGEAANNYNFDEPIKSLTLESRDIAWIVSKEEFQFSDYETTALVTLRSAFTKKGLLALDVGLVDPGYHGPIGTIVINFSKDKITLSEGDKFFRVVFLNHDKIPAKNRTIFKKQSKKDYIKMRHAEIQKDFPATFLGESKLIKEISDELLDKAFVHLLKKYWWKAILAFAVLVSAIIGACYFLLKDSIPSFSKEEIKQIIMQNLTDRNADEAKD